MPHDAKTNGATDGTKRISAAEAARMLGVTKDAVRYMVSRGELRPVVIGKGVQAWFERGEVIAYAATRAKRRPGRLTQGAIEAAAMVHFEAHHARGTLSRCVPDVVIATLLPAAEVIRLRDIFARERSVVIAAAPSAPPPEEMRAREERERAAADADFDRAMAARRKEIDRALGEAADDDDDEDRPRRKQR